MSQNTYNKHKQGTINCKCIKWFINKNVIILKKKVSAYMYDFTIKMLKFVLGKLIQSRFKTKLLLFDNSVLKNKYDFDVFIYFVDFLSGKQDNIIWLILPIFIRPLICWPVFRLKVESGKYCGRLWKWSQVKANWFS